MFECQKIRKGGEVSDFTLLYFSFREGNRKIASEQRKDMKEIKSKTNGKSVFFGTKGEGDGIYKRRKEENGSSKGI
jgi:hypothetical protein